MNRNEIPRRRRVATRVASLLAGSAVLAGVLVPTTAGVAAPLPAVDGRSAATAAASCWEIKQEAPSAPSGVYWLLTPQLQSPQQFYCDQTTDGGGWVLVGRGREGWGTSDDGQGTTAEVAATPSGTSAFVPRQLSVDTISGLLNGGQVKQLTDGVRLNRATTEDGSSWQEGRFTFSSPRDKWTWQFLSGQRIGTWTLGSSSGSGGTTESFGTGTGQNRLQTTTSVNQGWTNGFGFGTAARGNPAASSYVWAKSTSLGNPRPFTQVFLRPKLVSTGLWSDIPTAGTTAVQDVPVASSNVLAPSWGVTGLGAAGAGIQNTEVSAFAEVNGVVYVGGNFRQVQRNSSGLDQVQQSYLAAFDVKSGQWISSFRPTFNNQVKSLAALPNGRLAVGGQFSSVNGSPATGLVVLEAASGARDTAFSARLLNYSGGTNPIVRSLDVQGDQLYIGGNFTHVTGGTVSTEVYSRNAARVSIGNGTPDRSWNPELNGTVISLDASSQGDQVYLAGYFADNKGVSTLRAGALRASNATTIPWTVDFSNVQDGRLGYQQAVREVGGRVWLGGSEHMLFSYDRNTFQELSTNISQSGGDFQAISADSGYLYAGCHCSQSLYEGARKWPSFGNSWIAQSKIDQTGTWDATTGRYVPDFSPAFSMREGAGTWALFTDSTGVTWMGGDFTHAGRSNTTKVWTGSFARFPRRDAVAPTTPGNLRATASAGSDSLTWSGSTDAGGTVTYQVLRKDRVVATTTGTSVALPTAPEGTKYFVRAADPAGNVSASTPSALAGTVAPPPASNALITAGSEWKYYYNPTAPTAGWNGTTFSDGGWSTGAAPLGYGHSTLGTTLSTTGTKPITSYFRKSVAISDASKIASVSFTTRADDGIVLYVNGTEVHRANMPAGAIGHDTYASSAPNAAAALANPVTFTVPGSRFVTGNNVVTAEVHANYRSTPSLSFELAASATAGTQPQPDPQPEPAPTAVIASGSEWSYYVDGAAVDPTWNTRDFDAGSWARGVGALGWGSTGLGTTISTTDSPVPLAAYFRKSFTLDSVPAAGLRLTTRADDGVVIYVNGTEVGRANLPAGAVTAGTYATAAPSTAAAAAAPLIVDVPATALVAGTNVISAQVQSNYRSTPNKSFELSAVRR